jgi:hypothetical protein
MNLNIAMEENSENELERVKQISNTIVKKLKHCNEKE